MSSTTSISFPDVAAGTPPADDWRAWIAAFRAKHGRPPRLLHIGNIANNAYNNAKLLSAAGIDCDVLCYNYYHIMSCPEWEDADFDGEIRDQFLPDWAAVDLKGFRRPHWFAQGPLRYGISYLIAKRARKGAKARLLWWMMAVSRFLDCRKVIRGLKGILRLLNSCPSCRASGRLDSCPPGIEYLVKGLVFLVLGILCLLAAPLDALRRLRRFLSDRAVAGASSFDRRAEELVRAFARRFPERADKLQVADLEQYRGVLRPWQELFRHYDAVQAYSTDGIIPLLAGNRPYFAFEHGTLREIPFAPDAQGRKTALCYAEADHVFVTNADCLDNARKLAGDRVSFLNHPYDEDHGNGRTGWEDLRWNLREDLDADFFFFFPTRHDWVPGTGYADKANDVFLRAFIALRKAGHRVGMVCCRWGTNVRETMELLKKGGCSDHVCWSDPMGMVAFERTALACDVVVDQFALGSFGGILFKAMSLGVPVCTYLDEAAMRERYGDPPAVINCRSEDEIVAAMSRAIADPSALGEVSSAARKWIKAHYSSADTVQVQMEVYKRYVDAART